MLTAHYRDKINFTWESLSAAQNALTNLRETIRGIKAENSLLEQPKNDVGQFWQRFLEAANQDLNLPKALAVLWELVKSDLSNQEKSINLKKMDQVLGLGLEKYLGKRLEVPQKVSLLIQERESSRKSGDFEKSDRIRKEIEKLGFLVEDTSSGPRVKKK